jgi:serine phosphatase RsbU (regulator of sigma subunit)
MKQITFLLLSLLTIQGYGQTFADKNFYLVDSLEIEQLSEGDKELLNTFLMEYHSAIDDTSKVNALHHICENMMHHDWEKYQFFQYSLLKQVYNKELNSKEILHLKTALSHAANNIAVIYVVRGDVQLGLKYFRKSLQLKKQLNDKSGIADALNNLGRLQYGQGNIAQAMEHYENGLRIMEQIGDKKGMSNAYMSIGIIHKAQNDYQLAMDYYQKSLIIFLELEDDMGIAQAYNNIGVIHKLEGRLGKALGYHRKSLKIRMLLGDKRGVAETYTNIAQMFQNKGELDSAMFYSQKCLIIHKEANDMRGVAFTFNDMGEIYLELGQLLKAQEMGIKGLKMGEEMGIPIIINRHANLLCQVYEAKGEGMKALKMHRLFTKMTDSLNNESTQKASIRQQTKYEFEKAQVIRDNEHEKKIAVEKEAKAKQKVIIYGVVLILLLVIFFLYVVYNRLKITRSQKGIIEFQKKIVDEKNLEITDSITYARRIQNTILPTNKFIKKWLPKSFVLYKPKDIVAGDFYWMEPHKNLVMFAAADCTGHGVPGAMVSVVCHNALNRVIRDFAFVDPGKILDKTNEIVVQQLNKSEDKAELSDSIRDGMDIALCVLNLKTNQLQFSGANNPLWLIRNGGSEIEIIPATKQPIGKVDRNQPFNSSCIQLLKGDSIYVFSDGFSDQFGGPKGKKFKTKSFKELLLGVQHQDMEQQLNTIEQAFLSWQGGHEQVDDVCLMGVRI